MIYTHIKLHARDTILDSYFRHKMSKTLVKIIFAMCVINTFGCAQPYMQQKFLNLFGWLH